jgi:D-glycerate 3-kinase
VRGVPGTHDIDLGLELIDQLLAPPSTNYLATHPATPFTTQPAHLALPRFNKAVDDRKPHDEWHQQALPVDIVILEGWCVGAVPQPEAQLSTTINDLEINHDPQGHWRSFVNRQLAGSYQKLFGKLDYLVMLKAPTMEAIENWRWLQEQKLIAASQDKGEGLMNQAQVKHFIQHYERLTRHLLEEMPARADMVFHLNEDHEVAAVSGALAAGMTKGISS